MNSKKFKKIHLNSKNIKLFRKIVMDASDCISIDEARRKLEKRWPKSKQEK